MRRVLSLLVLGLLAGPLAADQVVLKDGRILDTKKPPEIRGRQAVLVLADGKLVSIPAVEIDTEKTAALAKKAAASAKLPAAPVSTGPPTLTDAARATAERKKATVVLTDQDIAGGYLEAPDEKKGAGAGRVIVSNVAAKKVGSGTTVTGSVQNVGEGAVEGVAVTVEVLGDKGQTVASAFGQLSADKLAPGEKATFTAQLDAAAPVQNVRAMPRWRSTKKEPEEGGTAPAAGTGKPAAARGEAPAAEATPAPTPVPTPAPEPTPAPPPPGWAAPAGNAPVGAPAQPGGTYLPPPSSDQPKPPGGGA